MYGGYKLENKFRSLKKVRYVANTNTVRNPHRTGPRAPLVMEQGCPSDLWAKAAAEVRGVLLLWRVGPHHPNGQFYQLPTAVRPAIVR